MKHFMNLKKVSALLAGCLLIAVTSISVNAAEWKYAMGEGVNDPQGIYATAFKNFIEENSRHTIEIYPVGSLGEEADMLEQTKAGILQFLGQSTGYMGGPFLKWTCLHCRMSCPRTRNSWIIFQKLQSHQ